MYPEVHRINLIRESDFPHEQIKLTLLFLVSICQYKKRLGGLFFFLFFSSFLLVKNSRNRNSGSCEQTQLFQRGSVTVTQAPLFHKWEKHTAPLWDLFLAFAMLLTKYFINNVNMADREAEMCRQSFHMHCHSNKMFCLYLFRACDS